MLTWRGPAPPAQVDTQASAGSWRPPADSVGHAWARPSTPLIFRGPGGLFTERTAGHRNRKASGSVNRWLRPDSVRHVSVTTAMQGITAAHHDTQRDYSKAAREPGYAQAMGHFRRWWQVLGSNQRRLSRRFYSPILLPESPAADQRIRRQRRRDGPPPSATCPCAQGRGRRDARTGTDAVRHTSVDAAPAPETRPTSGGTTVQPRMSDPNVNIGLTET